MKDDKQLMNLKVIFLILLFTIGMVTWFDDKQNRATAGFKLDEIKMDVDGWYGKDISGSEKEKEWIEQGDLLMRAYQKDKSILYLVAIQERGDRHRVHSPTDCYTGAGWVVTAKESIRLSGDIEKKVRRLRVVRENTSRFVYYWFTNGTEQCASFRGHLLLFIKDVLFKRSIKSWACFQISADIMEPPEATEKMMKNFISKLGY